MSNYLNATQLKALHGTLKESYYDLDDRYAEVVDAPVEDDELLPRDVDERMRQLEELEKGARKAIDAAVAFRHEVETLQKELRAARAGM